MSATRIIDNPFGPIKADELINDNGAIKYAYDVSNVMKETLETLNSRRALVVGRKGSGKTTLMYRMLRREAGITCILDIGRDFSSVASVLSKNPTTRFTEEAARLWSTVIWNSVILTAHNSGELLYKHLVGDQVQFIKKYVANLQSRVDEFSETTATRLAATTVKTTRPGSLQFVAAVFSAALESDLQVGTASEYVKKALAKANTRINVLIDTMEFYDIRKSTEAQDCMRGLLHCCSQVHNDSDHIACRLFFPGELTDFVKSHVSSSVLKDMQDAHYLKWNAPELVALAALRLRDTLGSENKHGFEGFSDWGWGFTELLMFDSRPAQRLLHEILPHSVTNSRGETIESISYILRHTQLTPRQFLTVLNKLTEKYFRKSEKEEVLLPQRRIEETTLLAVVERCAQEIYTDILSTFREIYPDVEHMLHRIIPYMPSVFSNEQLLAQYKKSEIKQDFGVGFEDMKTAFSDIGAVGIVGRDNYTQYSVEGSFSYMSEQRLILSASRKFCVHPVFSAVFQPGDEDGKAVYPKGSSVTGS